MKVATVIVDCQALRHNLEQIKKIAPSSQVMAVVKANGYGHGLLNTAIALQGADCFGVARVGEALTLRASGNVQPIVVLEGFFSANELPILVSNNIETVVHSIEQLEALENETLEQPIRVWMKIDTGMHRLGVRLEQAEAFYQRLSICKNVVQPVNLMSHLSHADEPQVDITAKQLELFETFIAGKAGLKSIVASAGVLLWPQAHYDWIRPGIIMYGVSPLANIEASEFGLKQVMTLKSCLIAVREHKAGESVGYGGAWVSEEDTRLGVVAIGYGDGYPRCAPSGTPVLVNNRLVPLVGRVSMDMLVVDLGIDAADQVGDEVILWGDNLPVEQIAAHTNMIPYELLTKLTSRVAIECIHGEEDD